MQCPLFFIPETDTVVLHSSPGLDVSLGSRGTSGVVIRNALKSYVRLRAKELVLHPEYELMIIKLSGKLEANETYYITMTFKGKLGNDRGFYKYHYKSGGSLR